MLGAQSWRKPTQHLTPASRRVVKMREVYDRALRIVGKPSAFILGWLEARRQYLPFPPMDVWLVQRFSQGSAQRCGSLLLRMGRGLPCPWLRRGFGINPPCGHFPGLPLSGLSYPSAVSPGWTGPFIPPSILLHGVPSAVPRGSTRRSPSSSTLRPAGLCCSP